jgi:hypothetical protein
VQSFEEVKTTIEGTLKTQKEEKYFQEWIAGFQSRWITRSQCASGYVVESCANYKGTGHPAEAPEACYEANPKTPTSECPAAVVQTKPALPGTVTATKPEGDALVQRPQPPASGKKGKEGKEGAEGAAEGAAGAEGSPETEAAAQKAVEEAAAQAAEESAKKGE